MVASLQIDRPGSSGTPGKSREDLGYGELITLRSVGTGTTHAVFVRWVPSASATTLVAVPTLTQTSPTTWTFTTPASGVGGFPFGTYLFELVVNAGTSSESRQSLTASIPTQTHGLVLPAFNEKALATTNVTNLGSAGAIAGANRNNIAPNGNDGAGGGAGWGWWKTQVTLFSQADQGGGGGGGTDAQSIWTRPILNTSAPTNNQVLQYNSAANQWQYKTLTPADIRPNRITVGNQDAGDTALTCDFLDVGDGLALQTAFTAAGAADPPADVFVKSGYYNKTHASLVSVPWSVPVGVRVICAGRNQTIFQGRSRDALDVFSLADGAELWHCSIITPPPQEDAPVTLNAILLTDVNAKVYDTTINVSMNENSPHTFVAGYFNTAWGSGVLFEHVDVIVSGTLVSDTIAVIPFFVRNASPSTTAYTNVDLPPTFRFCTADTVGITGRTTFDVGFLIAPPDCVVENCIAKGCGLYVTDAIGDLGEQFVKGPRLRSNVVDFTGSSATYQNGIAYSSLARNGTIVNGEIDGLEVIHSVAGTDPLCLAVTIQPFPFGGAGSPACEYVGFQVRGVRSSTFVAGTGGVNIFANAGATIRGTVLESIGSGLSSTRGDVTIGTTGTGIVQDVVVVGPRCRNITGSGSNVSNVTIVAPNFSGTISGFPAATTRVINGDARSVTFIVGNQAAGDRADSCDFLDVGDGVALQSAFAAANALSTKGKIVQRRGTYTVNQASVTLPLTVPAGWTWEGEGEYATIINTVPGGVGVNMTTFALAAGTLNARTTMRRIGLRVPENAAGVSGAGPRGIVNYNAFCVVEDIDVTVQAATVTNCASTFFQADYASAYPHGCVFRRITNDASLVNSISIGNCTTVIRSLCDAVAPTNGLPLPLIEDITYRGPSGLSGTVGLVLFLRPCSVDVRRIRTFFAQQAVISTATYSYTASMRGFRVQDVVNDIRGLVGTAPVTAGACLISHGCSNASGVTIYETEIADAIVIYDSSNIDTSAQDWLTVDGRTTYQDTSLTRCKVDGTVAGGLPIRVRAINSVGINGTIDGLTLTNCGGKNTDINLRTEDATNVLRNVRIVAPYCRNLTTQVTAGTLDRIMISAPIVTGSTTIGSGTTRVLTNGVGTSFSSSANSFTIPDMSSFVEASAATGAIAATLSTPTPGTWLPMQIVLTGTNAAGLTVTAPGGFTIMGAASFLLPGSNAAPSTTADRGWQLRLVGTDFRVV